MVREQVAVVARTVLIQDNRVDELSSFAVREVGIQLVVVEVDELAQGFVCVDSRSLGYSSASRSSVSVASL